MRKVFSNELPAKNSTQKFYSLNPAGFILVGCVCVDLVTVLENILFILELGVEK